MRNVPFVVLRIIFATCVSVSVCGCAERLLTEQQIIEIANSKAESEGFSLKESNVNYDVGNTDWHETLASLKKDRPDYFKERDSFNELRGRKYQTVIYIPKSNYVLGGILFVFVDSDTGEVITIYGQE